MNFIENMNLFWVSRKELYNYSNSIPAAVYAFCWLDKIPSDTQWPHEIEDTFYIGMSGGLSDEYLGDKKNKNKIKMVTPNARPKNNIISRETNRWSTVRI